MTMTSHGVTFPLGFRAAAVEAAIKKPGRDDLMLLVADGPAVGAAVFTTNLFAAAPVVLDRALIERGGPFRAIVCNAGNANAGTGERGLEDAQRTAALVERELGVPGGSVLVASTGVIGRPLPMDRVEAGVRAAVAKVRSSSDGAAAARAIMTTDTVPKTAERTVGAARIGGMCKGAGMIHPGMATMLGFITTDASLDRAALQAMLARVVDRTFNCISVDNDMSTNDTVFLLASGAAGPVDESAFESALEDLCRELALRIVEDGEGATKVVTIEVTGARTDGDARLAADAVATSMLVKTALHGNDPNWGRILAAVGRSGAAIDTGRIRIVQQGVTLFEDGLPVAVDMPALEARVRERAISIHVEIGLGDHARTVWTTDLSKEYVAINAEYTT